MPEQDYRPFEHLTTPRAEVYRRIMGAFVAAKRRFTVHLRPEDVHAVLSTEGTAADVALIAGALSSLTGWGNLRADPDTSRVTTVEDFHRARFLYQLTPAGEAAEQALATFDEALGRRGALQAVALADISPSCARCWSSPAVRTPTRPRGTCCCAAWSTGSPTSPTTRRHSWGHCTARSTCTTPTRTPFGPTRTA